MRLERKDSNSKSNERLFFFIAQMIINYRFIKKKKKKKRETIVQLIKNSSNKENLSKSFLEGGNRIYLAHSPGQCRDSVTCDIGRAILPSILLLPTLNFPSSQKLLELSFRIVPFSESGSSILGGGIRENAIPEALYATIPDTANATANETGNGQLNAQSRPVYAIPSMVSPPPTYDVAISKTWQVRDYY